MASISVVPWISTTTTRTPMACMTLLSGSRTHTKRVSCTGASTTCSLSSSFLTPSSSLSSSSSSSFSGMSLGLDLSSNIGVGAGRCRRLVVKAGKEALGQTKRNRSRKSLARTHGFRIRMRTTSGRAVLKRRRAKGRKRLCTKTNPSNGKRA